MFYLSEDREKDRRDTSPCPQGLQDSGPGAVLLGADLLGPASQRNGGPLVEKANSRPYPPPAPHSPPPLPINMMNSRLHQLMDQGTLAPGDGVRYIDHAGGGVVYEATLDRHGNIIGDGHPHPHPLPGGGASHPGEAAVLVFPSAGHFVRHCARLDSRPSSRHYSSLYINGVAWPNLFQRARDREQPNGENAPDAYQRRPSRYRQPSKANGVQEGREDKGKENVHISLQFPTAATS